VSVESIKNVSIKALTDKRRTSLQKLAKLAFLIKMIKAKKASAGTTKGGPQQPGVIFEERSFWDDVSDALESLDELFGSFEASGGDVEGGLELLGLIILLF
jgi:hypothetical protein